MVVFFSFGLLKCCYMQLTIYLCCHVSNIDQTPRHSVYLCFFKQKVVFIYLYYETDSVSAEGMLNRVDLVAMLRSVTIFTNYGMYVGACCYCMSLASMCICSVTVFCWCINRLHCGISAVLQIWLTTLELLNSTQIIYYITTSLTLNDAVGQYQQSLFNK